MTDTEGLLLEQAVDGVAPDEVAARETLRLLELAHERLTVYLPSHDAQAVLRLEARAVVQARSAEARPSRDRVPRPSDAGLTPGRRERLWR